MRILASVLALALTACTTVTHAPAFVVPTAKPHAQVEPAARGKLIDPYVVYTQSSLVKFARDKNPKLSESEARRVATRVEKYAKEFDLDPFLYMSLVSHESTFKRRAVSYAGAKGYAQVIPKWHPEKVAAAKKRFGTDDIYNIDVNLYVGAAVLAEYKARSRGNIKKTLLRYNGSLYDSSAKYAKTVLAHKAELKKLHKENVTEEFFRRYSQS